MLESIYRRERNGESGENVNEENEGACHDDVIAVAVVE